MDSAGTGAWTLNVPTRAQAVEVLLRTIAEHDGRTLLGVDFSLGFPSGTAQAWGVTGEPWAATWALLSTMIVDDVRNRNNRFEVASALNARVGAGPGPFWGCPPSRRSPCLTSTKVDPDPLPTWRHSEQALREVGHRPFSCWQLLGAGAVGSQTLLGISALRSLVTRLGDRHGIDAHVWPFTTGLAPPGIEDRQVVIAEVWPSMIALDRRDEGRVRDEAQVLAVARMLVALDGARRLDALFAPRVDPSVVDAVVDEEGWVLGAGTTFATS